MNKEKVTKAGKSRAARSVRGLPVKAEQSGDVRGGKDKLKYMEVKMEQVIISSVTPSSGK